MARWMLVFAVIIALIGAWLIINAGPRNAEDLGIGGLTQYELACQVVKDARQVEELGSSYQRAAKKLARRNALVAGFITLPVGRPAKEIAELQYQQLCGPKGATGNHTAERIEAADARLYPGHDNLEEMDNEVLWRLSLLASETFDERLYQVAGPRGVNAEHRERLCDQRRQAEEAAEAGQKIAELTGDQIQLLAAQATSARYAADWELLLAASGLPVSGGEDLTEFERLYGEASEAFDKFHGRPLDPETKIRPLMN